MNRFVVSLCLLATATAVHAQEPASVDDMVNRAIAQETTLLKILRPMQPVVETYIQDMKKDSDYGAVPQTDHYFLGKMDLSKGVSTSSFIPKSSRRSRAFSVFTSLFKLEYLPKGFAQMMFMDTRSLDRSRYDFEFVRREFLGDVRTYLVTVTPKKGAGKGSFLGRIWIEDKGFNIVRFNGTYASDAKNAKQMYMHFDSWRTNAGPDLWVPAQIYSEETNMKLDMLRKKTFKAQSRIWGYGAQHEQGSGEFTNITVEGLSEQQDKSAQAADNSPLESLRAWERQGEDNILHRMEKAAIVAPAGPVEKVLETVVNNLIVTNDLNIIPDVRVRVLLTTPLETFSVGHTIIISRGLLDTIPDEPGLAAILAHELAHISLGHIIDTKFAFADRVIFDDEETLKKFRFTRTQQEEDAANKEAVKLLEKSPYKDKLSQAGLYLKALGVEGDRLPALIKALFGSKMADKNNVTRLSDLIQRSPELQRKRTDQISALPLGGHTKLDPWTDQLQFTRTRAVPILAPREKMPFEIVPINIHLTRQGDGAEPPAPAAAPAKAAPPK